MAYTGPKGRNISNENLREIFEFIDNFKPKNEVEERDLAILKYAYEQDMSAESIYKLNDPRMIGYSNNNYGKRMTPKSIRYIIKSYNLERESRIDFSKRKSYKRRNEYANYSQKEEINKPKICGCCGSKKDLNLHHIIPIYMGGKDEYYNLIYLCHECHRKMHNMLNEKFGKWEDISNNQH